MVKHYAYESPFKMVDKDGNEYLLTVENDECPESPRDWDNVCIPRYLSSGSKTINIC